MPNRTERGMDLAGEARRPSMVFPGELQVQSVSADIPWMLRVLGIPALLIVVFVGFYLASQDAKSTTPSASDQQATAQAQSVGAEADFGQVLPGLQAYFDQNQTYVGATLPPGSGVVLASANATAYCLQEGNEHEIGPGGTPQPGPC
jgi:hypothetical protein